MRKKDGRMFGRKVHTNWLNRIRIQGPNGIKLLLRRKFIPSLSLGEKPLCLVCQLPMKRNNDSQILKYHTDCRQHKNVLTRETRDKTP